MMSKSWGSSAEIFGRNSTISNNRAGIGSGILNHGRLTLKNCTISGNNSRSQGGGIFNGHSGVTEVFACTINNNGTGHEGGGGINNNTGGYVYMWNTILVGNRSSGAGPDCYGRVTSCCCNIVDTNQDATVTDYVWGDMTPWDDIGGKPLPNGVITPEINAMQVLEPLGSYGGYTRTHALKPGSPAIDRGGSVSGFPLASWDPLETDQRDTIRPRDGDNDGEAVADIGAYEY